MRGQQQVTSFDVIRRIADGLRIPGSMVGLSARPWEGQKDNVPPPPPPVPSVDNENWRRSATVCMAVELTRSDLVMDRRSTTRALAGAAALSGVALLEPLESWLQAVSHDDPGPRRGRMGMSEVQELECAAQAFRTWDHQYGGGLRRKAVVGQLNEVAGHLDEYQASDVRSGLFRVMAYLAGTAATISWDSGLQRRAQDYYLLALRSAHAGGAAAYGANVLAGMARQMLYMDRPQDALELVHLAQKGARHIAGPRLRAMMHTREAWAYAVMGRAAAFRRATDEAKNALAGADDSQEPYWIEYFDKAELAGVTGGRHLDLARQERRHARAAIESIQEALNLRGAEAGRSYALDSIGLAECHFIVGDAPGAVDYTRCAVEAASHTRSSRVRARLGELYPYTVGGSTSQATAEARTMIRDFLSS